MDGTQKVGSSLISSPMAVQDSKTKLSKVVCMQINLQHSKQATAELTVRLSKLECEGIRFVALVTEPWVVGGSVVGLNRFNPMYVKSGRPRAAICISKELKPWFLPGSSDSDLASAEIRVGQTRLTLSSAYCDINGDVSELTLWRVAADNHIVGMDSNAHSALWSNQSNSRGESMEEKIALQGWEVANTGLVDTFVSARASSIIDITLARGRGRALVNNWRSRLQPVLF